MLSWTTWPHDIFETHYVTIRSIFCYLWESIIAEASRGHKKYLVNFRYYKNSFSLLQEVLVITRNDFSLLQELIFITRIYYHEQMVQMVLTNESNMKCHINIDVGDS